MKVETIPIGEIRENSYNPNRMEPEMFEALVNCIRDHGFVQPLVVRKKGSGYEIVDGAHRFRALEKLGRTEAECVVVTDEAQMARLRTLAMNRLRGRMDYFGVSKMLEGMRRPAIEKYLAYTKKHSAEMRELMKRTPVVRMPPAPRTPVVVEFLMTRDDAAEVRQALAATGEESRNESLLKICRFYLENGAESGE
jgi:ParB-like chromosome segregation protein Spo0J